MPNDKEVLVDVALTDLSKDYLESEMYRILSRVLNRFTDQIAVSPEFDTQGSDELATAIQTILEQFTDPEAHRALAKAIVEARSQRPAQSE